MTFSNFLHLLSADFCSIKEIAFYFFYVFGLLYIIKKWSFFKDDSISSNSWSLFFLLKVVFGFLLWLFYSYYSSRLRADTFKYFDDSLYLYNAFKDNSYNILKIIFEFGIFEDIHIKFLDFTHNWYKPIPSILPNDNRTVIKFNALLRYISFGNYHIHSLFFNFLSLIGVTFIYKSFKSYFNNKNILLASLLFIPSFLFWSSGLLKESILLFNIGLFIYNLFKVKIKPEFINTFLLGLSTFFFIYIKMYILIALIPASLFYLLSKNNNFKTNIINVTTINICAIAVISIIGITNSKLSFYNIIEKKQEQFINHTSVLNSGSRFEITDLEPNILSFIKNSPEAITNTVFRPFFWETTSLLSNISALENAILLIICIVSIANIRNKDVNYPFLLFIINIWLILYLIIGYTTPVWGAMSRYKIAVSPLFLLTFTYLLDKKD